MNTCIPLQWSTMGWIPRECWGDEERREMPRVHRPRMAILTGEDERNNNPDDFDGLIRLGLHSAREVENAAFRLCQGLKYESIPLRQTDEIRLANVVLPEDISDNLTEVAKRYINRGDGVDGLVEMFRRAEEWRDGAEVRCTIIDFIKRLRWVCGIQFNRDKPIRLEITDQSQDIIRRRGLSGRRNWIWRHLDAAINGKLA